MHARTNHRRPDATFDYTEYRFRMQDRGHHRGGYYSIAAALAQMLKAKPLRSYKPQPVHSTNWIRYERWA